MVLKFECGFFVCRNYLIFGGQIIEPSGKSRIPNDLLIDRNISSHHRLTLVHKRRKEPLHNLCKLSSNIFPHPIQARREQPTIELNLSQH